MCNDMQKNRLLLYIICCLVAPANPRAFGVRLSRHYQRISGQPQFSGVSFDLLIFLIF